MCENVPMHPEMSEHNGIAFFLDCQSSWIESTNYLWSIPSFKFVLNHCLLLCSGMYTPCKEKHFASSCAEIYGTKAEMDHGHKLEI